MFIQAQGVRTHVIIEGEGEPLLLVHGWGGAAQSLSELANLLKKRRKRKVIRIDLPGFGKSEIPPQEWGTADYAQALLDLLDKLNIRSVDYFGHSYGGALGIYLAAKHPARLRRLILCNSSFKRTQKKSRFLILKYLLHPFAGILPTSTDKLRILLYRIFFRHSDISRYPHLEQVFKNIVDHDLTPLVKKIRVPTLIIWGEDDRVTPLAWGHELHETISQSSLVTIPNERHSLPIRSPERIIDPIDAFLSA